AWRDALRQSGWTAAILSGSVEEYRPLLGHLLTSPDWHLAALTNQGYLFLRTPGTAAPSIHATEFHLGNARDTAVYLAQIAGYYDAAGRPTAARACIEQALQIAPASTAVLSHAATFAVAHKRWQEAIAFADKTLAREPGNPHARLVKALALLETGQAGKALPQVDEVLDRAPEDLYSLFLKARICRTLNDYVTEAETLERVVAVNEKAGMPVTNYRIFLGQAYARQGQAEPALANYRTVLASGELNAEQAEEIREAIATIEAKTRP
ncbi:MAG TPA: tetratricopeptide repeat protein, partial [Terrimicrobiaceae bacterium]|nr:tetratricopeptide repeat protein [Terrimicrobiaceae bacterium]